MKRFVGRAVAALGAAVSVSAMAASTASVNVNGFTVTLYDLNPGDNVAPSIQFSVSAVYSGAYGSTARASATDQSLGSETSVGWSLVPFGPASANAAVGSTLGAASVSGALNSGGVALNAHGYAPGASTPGRPSEFLTSASVGDYPGLLFALSPFTMAVFTGHADLSVRTTVGVVNGPGVFASETANASFSLQVSGPAADGGQGSQQSTTGRSASASWESVYNPSTGQFTYTGQSVSILDVSLATSFTNFTTAPMSGYMNLTLNASGNSAVPAAVPEPASYALMALGLTVLAIARRRR